MVLPVAVALMAGVFDIRMFVVAFVLMLVIWQMALTFVWLGNALEPASVRASCPHAVEFDEDGFCIVYAEREGYPTPASECIEWRQVKLVEHEKDRVLYQTESGRLIVVPASVMDVAQWRCVNEWSSHR